MEGDQEDTAPDTELFNISADKAALAKRCPPEFRDYNNEWNIIARLFCYKGGDRVHCEWRSTVPVVRGHQRGCLTNVIASDLSDEEKEALVAWMLSRMFYSIPTCVRKQA